MDNAVRPLLTLAIPTYNRASCLDECLAHICPQVDGIGKDVEILVSDNNSPDETGGVVDKYISAGAAIRYVKNEENMGPDRNFLQCFRMAQGKYLLILGDDDILLEGSVKKILGVLEKDDYGVVHLASYGFAGDYRREMPLARFGGHEVYDDVKKFTAKAHYFLTFTSSNVVNRLLVDESIGLDGFCGTNLVQLGWTFSAMLRAKKNAVVKEYLLAARLYNSGGYGICEIFGRNLNRIARTFMDGGADEKCFDIINKKLLSGFFPANIARARMGVISARNDCPKTLYPLYRGYLRFWLFTVPAMVLPRRAAWFLYSLAMRSRTYARLIKSFFAGLSGRKPFPGGKPGGGRRL
ncbi:MAG: glycosyltransferase family 2 protein [Nitrospiraceae bacterium]|nr:glycosyltransferase family 2 protein [Nitrospiraceae bacterium]